MEERSPVPWHLADLALFVAFFLGAAILVPIPIFLLFRYWNPGAAATGLPGPLALVAQFLINVAVVGFVVLVIRLHGRSIRQALHWVPTEIHVGWLISAGVFLALTGALVGQMFPDAPESALDRFLDTPSSLVALTIYGIAVAPITEELLFRGFLYTVLADLYPKLALPVTAFAFGALHFVNIWGNWAAMVSILVVGFVLTVVRKRTNSVIPSVIMHTAYNSLIFGLGALGWLFQHKPN